MDKIDRQIIDLIRGNARIPVSELARAIGLSGAAAGRRLARLEADGVIRGYVALVDEDAVGDLEAFVEIRLSGQADADALAEVAGQIPEVQEYFIISGDPDALVRFRVRNVGQLQAVINSIRRSENVAGTKTLIVLSSGNRAMPADVQDPSGRRA